MSEPNTSNLIDIKCLKPDSVVTVEIPAALHNRIQNLLMVGIPFSNLESLQKILTTIKTSDKDPDIQTYHTRTLLWLLSQIEEAAERQNKIEIKKLDRSTGKSI